MAQPLLPATLSSLMPAQNNLEVMPESPTAPAKRAGRDRRQRVQSAEMGMLVLKGLAQLGGRASLSHLAAHVQHSPAKLHRYLTSLQEEGVVCQDGSSQQYYLGHEAILIGLAAIRQADPLRLAEPALVQLCENFGMTSFSAGQQRPHRGAYGGTCSARHHQRACWLSPVVAVVGYWACLFRLLA